MSKKYPFLYFVLASGLLAALIIVVNTAREKPGLPSIVSGASQVALINVSGIMTSSSDMPGETFDARTVVEKIKEYGENESVGALVLRVNSPGGTVVAAQEMYEALVRFRSETEKPVVVSMADVAASGGYYIACAADRIFANAGSITGSIGVIMEFPNFGRLFEKIGVGHTTIKSGTFKDTGNAFREMTAAERETLQGLVDNVYEQFLEAVRQGRNLPMEELRAAADGRVFSGLQARDLGLIDEIGDLDRAVREAASLAGMEGEPEILEEKRRPRFWDLLEGRIKGFLPAPRSSTTRLLYLWK